MEKVLVTIRLYKKVKNMDSKMKSDKKNRLIDAISLISFSFCCLLAYSLFRICGVLLAVAVFSIITIPIHYWIKQEKESAIYILLRIVFIVGYCLLFIRFCILGD